MVSVVYNSTFFYFSYPEHFPEILLHAKRKMKFFFCFTFIYISHNMVFGRENRGDLVLRHSSLSFPVSKVSRWVAEFNVALFPVTRAMKMKIIYSPK